MTSGAHLSHPTTHENKITKCWDNIKCMLYVYEVAEYIECIIIFISIEYIGSVPSM